MNSINPSIEFAKYLWENFRGFVVLVLVTLAIGSFVDAFAAVLVAPIFNLLLQEQGGEVSSVGLTEKIFAIFKALGIPETATYALVFFMSIYMLRSIIAIITAWFVAKIYARFLKTITLTLYKAVINANWQFYLTRNQGDFINSITRETGSAGAAFNSLNSMVISLVQILFFGSVAMAISWQITLICLSLACLGAIPLFLLTRLNYAWGEQKVQSSIVSTSVTQESFLLAKIIQAFAKQKTSIKHLEDQQNIQESLNVRFQALGKVTQELFYPLGLIAVVVGYYFSKHFNVPFAELSIILYALWKCVPFISGFLKAKGQLGQHLPSFFKIRELEEDALQHPLPIGGKPFNTLKQAIRIQNLSFTYHNTDQKAIDTISFDIPKGEMTAFVGASGSGKSTLADLIMGFHTPQEGKVLIDGTNLNDLDLATYRSKIGYVPQQSILFNMTIRENLLWAQEDATDEDIIEACKLANAWGFIQILPKGLGTEVGDRGTRLSGGQIQRLAIARAILRKPEILVLDEATSALDTESEQLIQESIDKIAEKTTLIVIAHRLSTIRNAENIIVMDMASIEEMGSFEYLTRQESIFQRMVEVQYGEES